MVTTQVIEVVKGVKGDSGYDAAVQRGFVGTETQWFDSLPGTIAYAENSTGTVQELTSTATFLAGCMIHVTPTLADVWIEYGASFGVTAVGPGNFSLTVIDIQNGNTYVDQEVMWFPTGASGATVAGGRLSGRKRIGPVTSNRTFAVYAGLYSEGSPTLSGYVNNNAEEYGRSYITAVAR